MKLWDYLVVAGVVVVFLIAAAGCVLLAFVDVMQYSVRRKSLFGIPN